MKLLLATMLAAVTTGVTSTAQASLRLPHEPFSKMTRTERVHYLKRQIRHDHSIIRFWKNHRSLTAYPAIGGAQVKWARQSLRIAGENLRKLTAPVPHAVAGSSGVISALMCIHSYEGAWDDPDPPYWGGFQMDYSFQSTYGPEFLKRWGTADNWPVWAQLQAAVRATHSRGFSPWPTTAHSCGLL